MAYRIPALLALLLATPACQQQDSVETGQQQDVAQGFDADLDRHLASVAGRDIDTLTSTLADDVTVIFPDGTRVDGKEAVLDFHRDWFADDQWVWEPEVLEARAGSGGIANALVRYTYRDTPEGEPRQRWLVLHFQHGDQGWLLYHDQNTPVPPTDTE